MVLLILNIWFFFSQAFMVLYIFTVVGYAFPPHPNSQPFVFFKMN